VSCARLSWPFVQLLSARKYIVLYRMVSYRHSVSGPCDGTWTDPGSLEDSPGVAGHQSVFEKCDRRKHEHHQNVCGMFCEIISKISFGTSTCVLSNSGLSNATSKRPKFVEKCGNYCRDIAKIGIRTFLKSDIYFRFFTETIVD